MSGEQIVPVDPSSNEAYGFSASFSPVDLLSLSLCLSLTPLLSFPLVGVIFHPSRRKNEGESERVRLRCTVVDTDAAAASTSPPIVKRTNGRTETRDLSVFSRWCAWKRCICNPMETSFRSWDWFRWPRTIVGCYRTKIITIMLSVCCSGVLISSKIQCGAIYSECEWKLKHFPRWVIGRSKSKSMNVPW